VSHADTIRSLLPLWHVGGTQGDRVYAAVDAMEAENQQLRDAAQTLVDACAAMGDRGVELSALQMREALAAVRVEERP
jgi:hypothetical protein